MARICQIYCAPDKSDARHGAFYKLKALQNFEFVSLGVLKTLQNLGIGDTPAPKSCKRLWAKALSNLGIAKDFWSDDISKPGT